MAKPRGAAERPISGTPVLTRGYVIADRRRSQCPACRERRGTPLTVAMSTGKKAITYRCERCGHEWTIIRPDKPIRPE